MEQYLQQFADGVLYFRSIMGDIIGPNLYIFELMSLVISGVLLWGIIFTATQSNYLNKRIEEWMDYLGYGDVGKLRRLKAWKQIVKKMASPNSTDWKLGIMEADRIFDDMIRAAGYRAITTEERYKQIPPEFVANFEDIQAAHKIRNRCVQEPDFALSKEEAIKVLRVYKKSFQEFGLLD
ncbi:MAG: hypothetical protein Q7S83_00190 [bacterium]|nr:hypothetical protein [bacterium]